jgi:uncharacterized protein (TIGR02147 family)
MTVAKKKKRLWAWSNDSSIFTFDNYRRLIKNYIKELRMRDPEFSFTTFAKETGHKSRGHIVNILSGKKNASTASILAIARVMELSVDETRYFVNLTNLENTENREVRMFYDREVKRDLKLYAQKQRKGRKNG